MSDTALHYLSAAAEAGTMRGAGEKLGIAVSSISRQIAQLETDFAAPLIERGRRSIRLTEAGRLALDHYRNQLAERESFLGKLADLRSMRSGSIHLTTGEGFLGQALTDLFDDFQQRYPQVRLTIDVASTTAAVQKLLSDETHVALVFNMPSEPKIRLRSSAVQPLMAIVAPGHPLAGRTGTSLEELSRHALCLAPRDFRMRQIVRMAEMQLHLFLDPMITTNSLFVMRQAARSGRYATILPPIGALAELEAGTLVAVPITDAELQTTMIALVTRAGRQLEGAPLAMLTALERRLRTWTGDGAP